MSFQPGANLYTQGFGSRPENIEVPHIDVRPPNDTDVIYPIGKWWLYIGNSLWYLLSQSSQQGKLSSNWVQISGSGGSGVNSVNASNGITASPTSGNVIVSGVNATTSSVGVASFDSLNFSLTGAGTVSALAVGTNSGLTSNGVIIGNGSAAFTATSAGTSGQVLTSNGASSSPTFQNTSSSFVWNDQTSDKPMLSNTGYTANGATLIILTLPITCFYGSIIKVVGKGVGGWQIAQNAGQIIHFGNINTTSGITGYIQSSNQYDAVEILCTVEDKEFTVINGPQGNITYN